MTSQSKPRLHYGNPDPARAYNVTFCGRWIEEVMYWATPTVAEGMTLKVCTTCARSLAKKQRP